jgi:3-oxoacyl-[acyl-carrier protein] reductase
MGRRFDGKVALVAGGAGGIGSAVCRQLGGEGATVICADLSELRLDAADARDWDATIAHVAAAHGRLDVLVTSFYSGAAGAVDTMTDEGWEASFRATSTGVFLGMSRAFRLLGEGSAVVNVASLAAHRPTGENIGYASAKAAVISMGRAAAIRGAARGIRVNTVTPGAIDTRALHATMKALAAQSGSGAEVDMGARAPLGRVGKPEEVAAAICFLASPEAAYITGAELIIDGGMALV